MNEIYISYEEYKIKYLNAQKEYNKVLEEKESLFAKTQPSAIAFDKEKVSGGRINNTFDGYLIEKEKKQIDQRLEEIKSIVEDRKNLLSIKEKELRWSTNVTDKIYIYRFINKEKIYKIARLVGYSEPQVYRILKIIRKRIKMIENDSFSIIK